MFESVKSNKFYFDECFFYIFEPLDLINENKNRVLHMWKQFDDDVSIFLAASSIFFGIAFVFNIKCYSGKEHGCVVDTGKRWKIAFCNVRSEIRYLFRLILSDSRHPNISNTLQPRLRHVDKYSVFVRVIVWTKKWIILDCVVVVYIFK